MNEEQLEAYNGLTHLQRKVALNSIAGMDNVSAYKAAGGKATGTRSIQTSAWEILNNHDVLAFKRLFMEEVIDEAIMSRDEMLRDLTSVARSTIHDVAEFENEDLYNEEGRRVFQSRVKVKNIDEISQEHQRLIKSVKQTRYGLELVLHDSMAAKKQIADLTGYNAPIKTEAELKAAVVSLTPEQQKLLDGDLDAAY